MGFSERTFPGQFHCAGGGWSHAASSGPPLTAKHSFDLVSAFPKPHFGIERKSFVSATGSRARWLAEKRRVSIIVPCHRVIGANGTLTGYGGGLERKRFLLDLERGGRLAL